MDFFFFSYFVVVLLGPLVSFVSPTPVFGGMGGPSWVHPVRGLSGRLQFPLALAEVLLSYLVTLLMCPLEGMDVFFLRISGIPLGSLGETINYCSYPGVGKGEGSGHPPWVLLPSDLGPASPLAMVWCPLPCRYLVRWAG